MTEQPDTAAIRAMVQYLPHVSVDRYLEVLDALDVARGVRDDYRDSFNATSAFWRERAEAAEARIAAALLVCCDYEWCGDGMECEVRRALTEGTGQ